MEVNNQYKNLTFCPYIKTEETINNLLIRDRDLISDKYELMPYPLAHWINTIGVEKTNEYINNLNSDKIRIFICQHILVDKLIFRDDDIIFTPHSSSNDRFISIPHYTVNFNRELMMNDREYPFSFLGSTTTHRTRKSIVNNYPNCEDSKVHWGLDKSLSEEFNMRYIKLLGNSNFSLCPRGTGISSVRLFESMSMGSIPIIIADGYELPGKNINWEGIIFFISEDDIINNIDINKVIENVNIEDSRSKILDIYDMYLSNENLHKIIIEELDGILL